MLVACLVVEIIQHRLVCLCTPTIILHQGQGHQNGHEQMVHAYVYRHAKFEYKISPTVRDMAIKVPVKQLVGLKSLRRGTLFGRTIFSKLDGDCFNTFGNSRTFIIFMSEICVTQP